MAGYSSPFRRIFVRRHHAQKTSIRAVPTRSLRVAHRDSTVAYLLCFYRASNEPPPGSRSRNVVLLCHHHFGGDRRETRWLDDRGARHRHALEGGCRIGCTDEHARPYGACHPHHWPRHQGDFSCAVFHDGFDGSADHIHDSPSARMDLSGPVDSPRISSCSTAEDYQASVNRWLD